MRPIFGDSQETWKKDMAVEVSKAFRSMALRSMLAIVFFIVVYMVLLASAIALVLLCGYVGLKLIFFKPALFTLVLGFGIISIGVLVLLFLVKFVFKQHKMDRSGLLEVTRAEQPELFQFLQSIVDEVGTDFPKRVYISGDVNASVFYDSSFLSMFIPVRKNLLIGVGLVNTVSLPEMKAILAHEFGHFSQRSMLVGSYVYHTNQVIHNLLFENDAFEEKARNIGGGTEWFEFFIMLGLAIVRGIQWILRKVYNVVNISYMALSREMEFHADAVAANVTRPQHLVSALLRADLAIHSFQTVIDYYESRIADSVTTSNVYPQQSSVMGFYAQRSNLPIVNGLPMLNLDQQGRYNKSRLVVKDQWASHPSTEERVERLLAISNDSVTTSENDLASAIFQDMPDLEANVTGKMFRDVIYEQTPTQIDVDRFMSDFMEQVAKHSLPEVFNGYFDNKALALIDEETIENATIATVPDPAVLFNDAAIDMLNTGLALAGDLSFLQSLSSGHFDIKTFDYDGVRYVKSQCSEVIEQIEQELKEVKRSIEHHDHQIYAYYLHRANATGRLQELIGTYRDFNAFDKEFDARTQVHASVVEATQFIHQQTPFDMIVADMRTLWKYEVELKEKIVQIMKEEPDTITAEVRDVFDKYLEKNHTYFIKPNYDDEALAILFNAMNVFHSVLGASYFARKKAVLEKMAGL